MWANFSGKITLFYCFLAALHLTISQCLYAILSLSLALCDLYLSVTSISL